MEIKIVESGLRVVFRVAEDQTVSLVDFSLEDRPYKPLEDKKDVVYPFLGVHLTGKSTTGGPSDKHDTGSENNCFKYVGHKIVPTEKGKELVLTAKTDEGLCAEYHMQFFEGTTTVRTFTTVTNQSSEAMGLEYVTSFMYYGISKNGDKPYYEKTNIYVPRNSWSNEAQWTTHDARDLGLSYMPVKGYNLPDRGLNRFVYGTTSSWSSGQYLPMGIVTDQETGEVCYFEIDYSGSWEIEYGSGVGGNLYVALLGPNSESMWWKNLEAGASFTTIPVAFGTCMGKESEAVAELTKYRRQIRRENLDDQKCFVVFNDYMNCLFGDPTEEKEKQIIDKAAALGCEYFCLDCGWYDKGPWWDRVGEWKESPERFPNGLKTVYEYARSKGLKMGMWLEIEVMGTECELSKKLPDNWFVCTHGKRRVDNKRYMLDFRNPEVRKYCSDTVDRLIADYGCEFFKIDYNCTTGPGSDIDADSPGDAMLEHYRAFYDWLREVYRKHPNLVIENCGSGAQRMDYGILALHSLQSTSDQTDYISNAYIASSVASAVTPEQGGMWVYPYEEDDEHIIFNMVNGLLLRPYMSGLVWKLSDQQLALLKEGIDVYKEIRGDIPESLPYFPLGFGNVKDSVLAYGLKNDPKAYLSVFCTHQESAEIPLSFGKKIKEVKVLYPRDIRCTYEWTQDCLKVTMPQEKCARLFEIVFE